MLGVANDSQCWTGSAMCVCGGETQDQIMFWVSLIFPILPTTHTCMRRFYCLLYYPHVSTWRVVTLMNVAWYVFSKYIDWCKYKFWNLCESACLWACSNMWAGLVSCHAFPLNINYLQLWRCVGGENAGRKEGGRKINEYMPLLTPFSSPRVRLSGETSDWKEPDGETEER